MSQSREMNVVRTPGVHDMTAAISVPPRHERPPSLPPLPILPLGWTSNEKEREEWWTDGRITYIFLNSNSDPRHAWLLSKHGLPPSASTLCYPAGERVWDVCVFCVTRRVHQGRRLALRSLAERTTLSLVTSVPFFFHFLSSFSRFSSNSTCYLCCLVLVVSHRRPCTRLSVCLPLQVTMPPVVCHLGVGTGRAARS